MSESMNLLGITSIIFAFWPIILLAPLNWRRNAIEGMFYLWIVFAILRILFLLFSIPVSVLIVSEPLNTILFFITGVILLLILKGRKLLYRGSIQKKVENSRTKDDLRKLSPKEFEDMVVEYYLTIGNEAKRTGSIGDHGVDVVVNAANGEKWVIQCKRWQGNVGEPIIRDFYGVIQHEKADKGIIITTGYFSNQAKEWVRGKPIELIEGNEFINLIKHARNKSSTITKNNENNDIEDKDIPLCPKCGKKMVIRTAKKGFNVGEKFWGCPSFTECHGIVKYI
jgi:restriction system protein